MKLTLTLDEAKVAIRTYYKLSYVDEVVFEDKEKEVIPDTHRKLYLDDINIIINTVESLRYTSDEKIRAIKELRQKWGELFVEELTLLSAKKVIENWEHFKRNFLRSSTIPTFVHSGDYTKSQTVYVYFGKATPFQY